MTKWRVTWTPRSDRTAPPAVDEQEVELGIRRSARVWVDATGWRRVGPGDGSPGAAARLRPRRPTVAPFRRPAGGEAPRSSGRRATTRSPTTVPSSERPDRPGRGIHEPERSDRERQGGHRWRRHGAAIVATVPPVGSNTIAVAPEDRQSRARRIHRGRRRRALGVGAWPRTKAMNRPSAPTTGPEVAGTRRAGARSAPSSPTSPRNASPPDPDVEERAGRRDPVEVERRALPDHRSRAAAVERRAAVRRRDPEREPVRALGREERDLPAVRRPVQVERLDRAPRYTTTGGGGRRGRRSARPRGTSQIDTPPRGRARTAATPRTVGRPGREPGREPRCPARPSSRRPARSTVTRAPDGSTRAISGRDPRPRTGRGRGRRG